MSIVELRERYESGVIGKHEFLRGAYGQHRRLFEYTSYVRGTNIRSLEITESGVLLEFRDPRIRMFCPPGDERHAAIESMDLRCYEAAELESVCRLFHGGVFFDIGANAGFYSLAVARRFPTSSIVAFEPIPANFEYLQRNIEVNGFTNITLRNIGLSDRPGELIFYYDPTFSVATSSAKPASGSAAEPLVCRVETVDEFADASGIRPDFIKCDVEGAELLVFRGARRTLAEQKPVVFTEMLRKWAARFGYHPNDIISLFAEFGYRCFAVSENGLRQINQVTDETPETNYFFLHVMKHTGLAA